jgi:hypothetical protein
MRKHTLIRYSQLIVNALPARRVPILIEMLEGVELFAFADSKVEGSSRESRGETAWLQSEDRSHAVVFEFYG